MFKEIGPMSFSDGVIVCVLESEKRRRKKRGCYVRYKNRHALK